MTNKLIEMTTHSTVDWNEENNEFIKSYLGSIVEFIESNGNRVKGVINKYESNCRAFHLIKASLNGTYFGNYTIYETEVQKWKLNTFIKQKKSTKNRSQISETDSRVLIPIPFNGSDSEEEEEVYLSSELESVDLNEDDDPIVVNLKNLPMASNDIILINKLDDDFVKAIDSIKSCPSVGFALFGDDISREGSIDLFAFANETAIYVFKANKQIVPKIKPILESENLQKIMYTCRQSSDALFQLFGIQLKNVNDIRITDYFLQKKNIANSVINNSLSRKWSKAELRSLDNLLWHYLNVKSPKFYPNLDYNQLSVRVQNVIRVQTIFLKEIARIINFRLMREICIATERCLQSLRFSDELEYQVMKEDEREVDIIESPINLCEENEKLIYQISAITLPNDMIDSNDSQQSSKQSFVRQQKS